MLGRRAIIRAVRDRAIAVALGAVLLLVAGACSEKAAGPKERHLVYVRGPDAVHTSVWIADENGAHARELMPGYVGILSPDGLTVAVGRRNAGIYLVSADGVEERLLTRRNLRPRAWSGDGKVLLATAASSAAIVELLALDRDSGEERVIARGSLYGVDVSPDGDRIVYSRAPEATPEGICGDQFDLYVADLDGGEPTRLTHGGLSAFPVWGRSGIAFSRFQAGLTIEECSAPGIWSIDPDGSDEDPILARPPGEVTASGYYGLQPLDWLDDDELLVGQRSAAGSRAALLDRKTGELRRLVPEEYADQASSDGDFLVGSGGSDGVSLAIVRIADGRRVFYRENACCPDWNR